MRVLPYYVWPQIFQHALDTVGQEVVCSISIADDTDIRFETHIDIPSRHYRIHVRDSHLRIHGCLAADMSRGKWSRATRAPVPSNLPTAALRLTWVGVMGCFEGMAYPSNTHYSVSIPKRKDRPLDERKLALLILAQKRTGRHIPPLPEV